MSDLSAQFIRARNKTAPSAPVGYSASAHCNACGKERRGTMQHPADTGLAVFRCDVKGHNQAHITIYSVERAGTGFRFRPLSRSGHFALGAAVRATHLRKEAQAQERAEECVKA